MATDKTTTQKREDAEDKLSLAKSAEVAEMKATQKSATDKRVADDMAGVKDDAGKRKAKNETLEGNMENLDSELKKVKITYKQENREDRIKVGAVVTKGGRSFPQRYKVPVDVVVELPVEVIAQIAGRKIEKYVGKELRLVPQFVIEGA